jgi:hypothetical protein
MRGVIDAYVLTRSLVCVDPNEQINVPGCLQRPFLIFSGQHKQLPSIACSKPRDGGVQIASLDLWRMGDKGQDVGLTWSGFTASNCWAAFRM